MSSLLSWLIPTGVLTAISEATIFLAPGIYTGNISIWATMLTCSIAAGGAVVDGIYRDDVAMRKARAYPTDVENTEIETQEVCLLDRLTSNMSDGTVVAGMKFYVGVAIGVPFLSEIEASSPGGTAIVAGFSLVAAQFAGIGGAMLRTRGASLLARVRSAVNQRLCSSEMQLPVEASSFFSAHPEHFCDFLQNVIRPHFCGELEESRLAIEQLTQLRMRVGADGTDALSALAGSALSNARHMEDAVHGNLVTSFERIDAELAAQREFSTELKSYVREVDGALSLMQLPESLAVAQLNRTLGTVSSEVHASVEQRAPRQANTEFFIERVTDMQYTVAARRAARDDALLFEATRLYE